MQRQQRKMPWALPWLLLVLAVPALAQEARGGEEGQLQPDVCLQVAQLPTVAVCGDTCDCAAGLLLTKVSAPCTVTSSVGPCSIGSGECCVCATD
jgi:hypothetical protein